jgi:hypothetical protein
MGLVRIKTIGNENKYRLAQDVKVTVDGKVLEGIQRLVIHPIKNNTLLTATITVLVGELDVEVEGECKSFITENNNDTRA